MRLWDLDGEGLRHIWGESRPGTQDISALAATTRFIAAATVPPLCFLCVRVVLDSGNV